MQWRLLCTIVVVVHKQIVMSALWCWWKTGTLFLLLAWCCCSEIRELSVLISCCCRGSVPLVILFCCCEIGGLLVVLIGGWVLGALSVPLPSWFWEFGELLSFLGSVSYSTEVNRRIATTTENNSTKRYTRIIRRWKPIYQCSGRHNTRYYFETCIWK